MIGDRKRRPEILLLKKDAAMEEFKMFKCGTEEFEL
jgi:hypothetical protein